jgi:large subunit ribosomal protein L31
MILTMKKEIHPTYNHNVKVKCMCGKEYTINSTANAWPTLEMCSNCHPVYNSGAKIEKAARGRLQAYQEKMAKIAATQK